jgi:hypothetical protein
LRSDEEEGGLDMEFLPTRAERSTMAREILRRRRSPVAPKHRCQASSGLAYMAALTIFLPSCQNCKPQLPNGWRLLFVLFAKKSDCQTQMHNRWTCSNGITFRACLPICLIWASL